MTPPPLPDFRISPAYAYDPSASVARYDWTTIITVTLLVVGLTQQILSWLDFPILSAPELLWNALVYLMPSTVVFGLRSLSGSKNDDSTRSGGSASTLTSHAEKSQALREVFRLGSGHGMLNRQKAWPTAPKGLGNWDNSCYQNSVLQALASLPSMQRFFSQVGRAFGGFPDQSTLEALHALADQLNDTRSSSSYYWTPAKLKSMSSWQQQDAQEYFAKLVDAMEKDVSSQLKTLASKTEAAEYSLSDFLSEHQDRRKSSREGVDGMANDNSARATESRVAGSVQTPFEGLLAQRVGCTDCGYTEGLSLIPFNCLTVPLGSDSTYDLRDCLNEFTELEFIDGVECAKCSLIDAQRRLEALSTSLANSKLQGMADVDSGAIRQQGIVAERLQAVNEALHNQDFSEQTLADKCQIKKNGRKSSRKSRQAAVMRHPKCLVIHVNRSMFNEHTGAMFKNHAVVDFPQLLDLEPWSIGAHMSEVSASEWEMNPTKPLVYGQQLPGHIEDAKYHLKAVITHYGRHENGHYICYRQSPAETKHEAGTQEDTETMPDELKDTWWRLSDEDVSPVDEADITARGGAFMLFYERQDPGTSEIDEGRSSRYLNTASTPQASPLAADEGSQPTLEGLAENSRQLLSQELNNEVKPGLEALPYEAMNRYETTDESKVTSLSRHAVSV